MPIDPRIPLQAEGIKVPNMLESATRVQSLRNMAQQNQLGAQNLEKNQLSIDETRENLKATEQARRIMAEEKDPRKAIERIRVEVGPRGVQAAVGIANLDASLSTMDENQLKLTGERLKMIGSAINPIRDMPEEQRAAAYDAAYKQLVANGIIDPNDPNSKVPPTYPGAETLDMMANSAVSVENQYKSTVAAQRAKAYADNIASLDESRKDKTVQGRQDYELKVRELERKLLYDENLDSRERKKLEAQLQQHRETLNQRAIEEQGRNRRHDSSEQGQDRRLEVREQGMMDRLMAKESAIWDRQQAMAKEFTPAQITAAYQRSMEFVAGKEATLEDLDDDQIEAVNVMAEQALKLESSNAGKTEGKRVPILGIRYGRDVQVTPGQPVGPRGGAAPARTTARTSTERPAAAPASKPAGSVRKKVKSEKMPQWKAEQYIQEAGGDTNKAIQWAIEDGWDINK